MPRLPPHVTILDGGMGRELKRLGAPFRQPEWSALALMEGAADVVTAAHERFLAAGAQVITTNSYAVCPFHVGDAVFASRGFELASLAGALARGAADGAGRGARVAGSLPPTCGSYRADLFDAAAGARVLGVLIPALAPHVDVWLAETLSTVAEAELAARALGAGGAGRGKPLWLSFTLEDGARAAGALPALRSGEPVAAAAAAAAALGAEALLFNCCQPEVVGAALAAARAALQGAPRGGAVALGAYANAFEPMPADAEANSGYSTLRAELSPVGYRAAAEGWVAAGATLVGGCCGIGPEFIAELAGLPAWDAPAGAAEAAAAPPPPPPPPRPAPLLPPALLGGWLEASVLALPRGLRSDVGHVLPGVELGGPSPLLVVPTCQRARMDLVAWGDAVAAEKDTLLERFLRWGGAVRRRLGAGGWWADFVDPCSGLPVHTPSSAVYAEVDAFEALLKWRTSAAGGCRVLLHPAWGTAVYPATLFARAPLDALRAAMEAAAEEEAAR
jgi:S-methylmethionine-dependent homocysteine/selenocysteine methylase